MFILFSDRSQPLVRYAEESPFTWTPEAGDAFQELKRALTEHLDGFTHICMDDPSNYAQTMQLYVGCSIFAVPKDRQPGG